MMTLKNRACRRFRIEKVAGGVASIIAGLIVVVAPSGQLLHFDVLGYVLVVTTAITLTLMYFIDRKIKGERGSVDIPAPSASTPEPLAVTE